MIPSSIQTSGCHASGIAPFHGLCRLGIEELELILQRLQRRIVVRAAAPVRLGDRLREYPVQRRPISGGHVPEAPIIDDERTVDVHERQIEQVFEPCVPLQRQHGHRRCRNRVDGHRW